jgi:hypothetical protein
MNKYSSSNLPVATSTHSSPPPGTAAAAHLITPSATEADQLVLLAAAVGLSPAGGWQAAGVTQQQLRELKRAEVGRLNELRQLAALGELYPAPLLTHLLKARLAQRLLASDNAAELERLAKIIERLPDEAAGRDSVPAKPSSGNGTQAGTDARPTKAADPDADVDSMELAEALAEAKRLIAQLETTGHDAAGVTEEAAHG